MKPVETPKAQNQLPVSFSNTIFVCYLRSVTLFPTWKSALTPPDTYTTVYEKAEWNLYQQFLLFWTKFIYVSLQINLMNIMATLINYQLWTWVNYNINIGENMPHMFTGSSNKVGIIHKTEPPIEFSRQQLGCMIEGAYFLKMRSIYILLKVLLTFPYEWSISKWVWFKFKNTTVGKIPLLVNLSM